MASTSTPIPPRSAWPATTGSGWSTGPPPRCCPASPWSPTSTPTPGGHQYVVVDNDHDGRWILPGDAVYTYANLEALSQPFPGGSAPDGAARPGAASPGWRPGRVRGAGPAGTAGQVRRPRAATVHTVSTRSPRKPMIWLVRLAQVQAWNG